MLRSVWNGLTYLLTCSLAYLLTCLLAYLRTYLLTCLVLRSLWNGLDLVIVVISLLVLLAEAFPQLQNLRFLKVLRVLRPLRLVARNAGMRLILTSLFRALPSVSNVFGFFISLQVIFAIVGMQLFSGAMASCVDAPSLLTDEACELAGHVWANPTAGSFDNIWEAMRLLYVMSSGDEWQLHMFRMMDTTAPASAPVRNDFSPASIFSVLWMVMGYIFAINLFVGVVVDNFGQIQQEESGSATMTLEQQQWAASMSAVYLVRPAMAPHPPRSRGLRHRLHEAVTSPAFDAAISVVVVANIGLMACEHWRMSAEWVEALDLANSAFVLIYVVECLVKLCTFGLSGYFVEGWNRLDFTLVCISIVDKTFESVMQALPVPPMLLRVLRILRILRILRLLKGFKELRDLIVTIVLSFPALLNVGSLLALTIFIFSVLGVQLFTFLARGGSNDNSHNGINEARNFDDVGSSALLLFQCLTGDGWSSLMADAMLNEDSGRCTAEAGNCGTVAAIPYFISFQILGSFIFLNLVVAVILENFGTLHNINPDLASRADIEVFAEAWAKLDPDATGFLESSLLPTFLLMVPPPLGLKGRSRRQAIAHCMRLTVQHRRHTPAGEGMVTYTDVLKELVDKNYFSHEVRSFRREVVMSVSGQKKGVTKRPTLWMVLNAAKTKVLNQKKRVGGAGFHDSVSSKFAITVIDSHARTFVANLKRKVALAKQRQQQPTEHEAELAAGLEGRGGGGGGGGGGPDGREAEAQGSQLEPLQPLDGDAGLPPGLPLPPPPTTKQAFSLLTRLTPRCTPRLLPRCTPRRSITPPGRRAPLVPSAAQSDPPSASDPPTPTAAAAAATGAALTNVHASPG